MHEACHVPTDSTRSTAGRWTPTRGSNDCAPGRPNTRSSSPACSTTSGRTDRSSRATSRCATARRSRGGTGTTATRPRALFRVGDVAATRRESDFARLYHAVEDVIPDDLRAAPKLGERESKKELLVMAARYHGLGTAADLADYHRLTHTRPLFAELVEEGRLVAVEVEGWDQAAYLHPDAKIPRRIPPEPCSARSTRSCGTAIARATVRLPLPHRDLRAQAATSLRVLRAAVPARRSAGRPGRPEGRSQHRDPARPGRVERTGRARARGRPRTGPRTRRHGRLVGARTGRGRRARRSQLGAAPEVRRVPIATSG